MSDLILIKKEELEEIVRNSVRQVLREEKQANPPKELKRYLNVTEAAAYIGVAKQTLYEKSAKGEIASIKPAKNLLFQKEDLDRWVLEGRRKSKNEIVEDLEKEGKL